MAGQIPDTTGNVDTCVEITDMTTIKFVDDSVRSDPTPYYKRVKTPDQIAKEGFPKFGELPAELRLNVWKHALPPYGIYTVLIDSRQETPPRGPFVPASVPISRRVVYRLEPLPRGLQDDELSTRIGTIRAIQLTNTEAASEVKRAFPTTIDCTRGKLRFDAEHDTLSLYEPRYIGPSRALNFEEFAHYSQGSIVFAGDWHKIPRKMVFNAEGLWRGLQTLKYYVGLGPNSWIPPDYIAGTEGFMEFLAGCTGLTSFGFMFNQACDDSILNVENAGWRLLADQALRFCRPAPIIKWSFYGAQKAMVEPVRLVNLVAGCHALAALIYGPDRYEYLEFPNEWRGIRFGRPELQHLRIQGFLPAYPALHKRMKGTRDEP